MKKRLVQHALNPIFHGTSKTSPKTRFRVDLPDLSLKSSLSVIFFEFPHNPNYFYNFHRKAALGRNRRSSDDMGPIAMDDDDNGGMFFPNDDHEDVELEDHSNHIPHAHVVEMNHISNLGTRFRNSTTNLLLVNIFLEIPIQNLFLI